MFMAGEELRAWARNAKHRASLVLGEGAALPSSTARVVSVLADAKIIDIARRKLAADHYRFIVQRRSARYVERATVTPRQAMARPRAGISERRILKILIRAAERNLPCPTNPVLAHLVGLSGEQAASYRMRRLVAQGKIRVEVPGDPRMHRVVTIVASGKRTRGGAR